MYNKMKKEDLMLLNLLKNIEEREKQNIYIQPKNYIKINIDRRYIGMTQEQRNEILKRNKKENKNEK